MNSKILGFGEVMLRLSPVGFHRIEQAHAFEAEYGGSEANVIVSLANFNHPTKFVTRFPANELGRAANASLRKFGVNTEAIVWGGNKLGIYFFEAGASFRQSKVIYDRFDSSMAQLESGMINWEQAFEGVSWFHWSGITPAISESAFQVMKEALMIADKKGIYISADLNYRQNLWKYGKKPSELMPELIKYCDLVSGGNDDSENMLGLPVKVGTYETTIEEEAALVEQRCFVWKSHFPKLKTVVSSYRRARSSSHNFISAVLWNKGEIFTHKGYEVTHIVDRVGAGDALMGGLIHALLTFPDNSQKILDFALAASCLKHTIHGDVNLVTAQEVEAVMQGNNHSIRIAR